MFATRDGKLISIDEKSMKEITNVINQVRESKGKLGVWPAITSNGPSLRVNFGQVPVRFFKIFFFEINYFF